MVRYKKDFEEALLETNRFKAMKIVNSVLECKGKTYFIEEVLVPSLDKIGQEWEHGNISLSQVYMSGRISEELVNSILPTLQQNPINKRPIAIVNLDNNHTLGKKITTSILKGFGYDLIDYGHGINADTLVEWIIRDNIEILLISVLMLPSALKIKGLVEQLKLSGHKVKILVGGAPFRFDKELWKEINADAMAESPKEANEILLNWMED